MTRKIIPVIISGGSGSRLWPRSRRAHPKPYVRLPDDSTLIGETFARAASIEGVEEICTVTNKDHFFLASDCYEEREIDGIQHHFILEPFGRNTAPAIAAAAIHLKKTAGEDCIALLLPADHMIKDSAALNEAFEKAFVKAAEGKIVTFGITPTSPETGFGYLEMDGDAFVRFVEKPELSIAQEYFASGKHFWNSGMFCFSVSTMLEALDEHCPDVLSAVEDCVAASEAFTVPMGKTLKLDAKTFAAAPDISIDYAVMEKADNIASVTTDCGWSDIGSWLAYSELFPVDEHHNRTTGDVVSIKSSECIVDAETRFVGLVGVKDIMVIDTPDALLVADKNHAQDVKGVFEALSKSGHEAAVSHTTVHRPWGAYTVLEEGERFKIKRIVVKPGAQLSLQAHHHRSEHWVVVAGTAKITNGDTELLLTTNQSTYIPCGGQHRLENPGIIPLVLIEVQTGEYLGEDDIVRFDDVYGRA
ncbi:MAG: mannose-1-phosphate guanylyltransferase/mannose-6-phosphate isomerase [Pseudomonadota bacterium]